jgi:hypothetical protein
MAKKWGPWRYDAEGHMESLDFSGAAGYTVRSPYQICRCQIDDCDKLVFWCAHLLDKGWGRTEVIGDLVKAVIELGWARWA